MRKSTGLYPPVRVDATGKRVVSHAGSVVLALTADKVGLGRELSAALAPWRKPMTVHDPGKVLLDPAISLAIGGDCRTQQQDWTQSASNGSLSSGGLLTL